MSHPFMKLTIFCLAMLPLLARTAAADQLTGTNVFQFGGNAADPLVWDISGTYNTDLDNEDFSFFDDVVAATGVDVDTLVTTLTVNQDASGNFSGNGLLHSEGTRDTDTGTDSVVMNLKLDVSGFMRFAAGITRVKFSMKITGTNTVENTSSPATGKLSFTCDVAPTNEFDTATAMMIGAGNVSFAGGSISYTGDFVVPEVDIATNMTGHWSATVTIAQDQTASGQVQLSNANTYSNLVANVVYNAARNVTRVLLKGNTAATKGIKIDFPDAKASAQQDRVLGKLLGQKVDKH